MSLIGNPLINEEYADLLIEYNGDISILESFGAPYHIINFQTAVVHIPEENLTQELINRLGYYVVPSIFGLVSDESLEASGVNRLRNIPNFNFRGQGVLIGLVDTGIDYTNPLFQYADRTTRIALIWDQTIQSDSTPEGFPYGTVYSRDQINLALQNENPFDIVPSRDDIGHGTMLAGIAGGSEAQDNSFRGVAPDAEFVVVKLKQAKRSLRNYFFIPEGAPAFQETDILFGLGFILAAMAELQKPLSLCVAVNTSQSSHDERGLTSRYLSGISSRAGLCTAVAAGNEGNARRHYFGTVNPSVGYNTVELNVGADEAGFSMELWGQSPGIFSIDILSPTGEYIERIIPGLRESRVITFVFDQTIIYYSNYTVESESGDQLILLRFSNPTPGIWRFNVYERLSIQPSFHIWLPMEGFISENTFFVRSDPYTTILALGNADSPITVTAYNDIDDSLYINASKGYTRLGVIKPEIAAPGVNVTGPTLNQGFEDFTGTSVATAHTCGINALLLEWGTVRNNFPRMNTIEIKKLLIRGARRDVNVTYPNRDWGYGILDIYNVFDRLRTGVTSLSYRYGK